MASWSGMNESSQSQTQAQLRLIGEVVGVVAAAGDLGCWLFGGWGLDTRLGRVTREHSDIEFWVERSDGDRVRAALVAAGVTVLEARPPEESVEYMNDGVAFSTAFFDRQEDGTCTPQGRWYDWVFPVGSVETGSTGYLEGLVVPAMSVEGMLAMKEQFATLDNGRPRREKDDRDIALLRDLNATSG
jgi:lincosamide nucleotidyltransferase A/C/D/E